MAVPNPPISLNAVASGSYTINLTWIEGDDYTTTLIERKPDGGSYTLLKSLSGHPESYSDTTCEDGTKYWYQIRGVIEGRGASAYSTADSAVTTLPAPSGLNGSSANGGIQADLDWVDNSQHEASFKVYKDGGLIYTTAANAISYSATGLTPGVTYVFKIRAYSSVAGYSAYSNSLSLTMADPPAKPTNLTATPLSTTSIRLNWTDNSDNEQDFHMEESSTGPTSGFASIGTVGANVTTYPRTGLISNTQYWYRVRAHNASGYSAYCTVATTVTLAAIAAPTNLTVAAAKVGGAYGVECVFDDNSELEDSHILERGTGTFQGDAVTDGALENWYSATDAVSWYEHIPDGGSTINREGTTKHGGIYAVRFDIDAFSHTAILIQEISLVPGAGQKLSIWYKTAAGKSMILGIRDGTLGAGGAVFLKADGTWQVSTYSWMVLPAATGWTEFIVEFQAHPGYSAYVVQFGHGQGLSQQASSSLYVDDLTILAGVFGTTVATLAPNRAYYHDATAATGAAYRYRVRAKQGTSTYSAYSNEAAITVPNVPAAPGSLTVSEYQDTWAKVAWPPTTGEVGYSIEISTTSASAGFTEVMRIGAAGVSTIRVTGLIPSTPYWFRVRAYNGAGYSTYSDAGVGTAVTTRAAYLPSDFDKLIRKSKPKLVYLVEVNPALVLTGWALTAAQTYTYEAVFDERGAAPDAITVNGTALTLLTSIATVEATAGSWWYDPSVAKIYVHVADGGDPANFIVVIGFWLYFTTWQQGATIYNGKNYLPLVASDGIPDISQEIQPYHEGSFAISSGTVSLINGKVRKKFYFDTIYARYIWLNRKVRIKAGGTAFTYIGFKTINTGAIGPYELTDRRFMFSLRDLRDGVHRDLPTEKYSADEFPFIDPTVVGTERPFSFGPVVNAALICVDVTNRRFEFNHGRVKTVSLTKNAVALTENTDYFVDYANGRITLGRTLAWSSNDILLVSFEGCINAADEAVSTGAEIFKYICNTDLELSDAELDLDSIYATKNAQPAALSVYLRKNVNSVDVFRNIEHSIRAYTFQDEDGRIGIAREQAAAASGAPYVHALHVHDFAANRSVEGMASEINIYYAEGPSTDKFALVTTSASSFTWRFRLKNSLDVYTYLATAGDALALGNEILAMMERPKFSFAVPRVLFTCRAGAVIPFNRGRFPSAAGSASNVEVRLLGISKQISSGRTQIKAEVI